MGVGKLRHSLLSKEVAIIIKGIYILRKIAGEWAILFPYQPRFNSNKNTSFTIFPISSKYPSTLSGNTYEPLRTSFISRVFIRAIIKFPVCSSRTIRKLLKIAAFIAFATFIYSVLVPHTFIKMAIKAYLLSPSLAGTRALTFCG